MSELGNQIQALRKSRKQSRAVFAEENGLKPGMLQAIETGREPKPKEIALLAPLLTTETHYIVELIPTAPIIILNEEEEDLDYEELHQAEPVHDDTRRISNSEMQAFKRCRRKWYLQWYRNLRLKEQKPLGPRAIGTQVHAALAEWYQPEGAPRTDPNQALENVLLDDWNRLVGDESAETSLSTEDIESFKKQCDLVRAMVSGYVEWIEETGQDEGLTVIAPETELCVSLDENDLPGIKLIGKLDVRVRREIDGAHLFIDHKTVANLTTPARTLHLDEQMMHYMLLEQLAVGPGEQTDGAIYNMIRKVKRTATAKPPFYERIEQRHNAATLESFKMRLIGSVKVMLDVERALVNGADHRVVAYPTPTKDCSWDCDFFAICSMFDDGSHVEAMIADLYNEKDPLDRYTTMMKEISDD